MSEFKNELTDLWQILCPKCESEILNKNGKYRGRQRFICLDCGNTFTTYSKSILDSTKLSSDKWHIIIKGIVKNYPLGKIKDNVDVSVISLSKIRKNIFKLLYPKNKFDKVLRKFYYDPFDTSSIFKSKEEKGQIYFHKYDDDLIILLIKKSKTEFYLKMVSKQQLNELMMDINFKRIDFIDTDETTDEDVIIYFERLAKFLKSYRGIKRAYVKYYVNFYSFLVIKGQEGLYNFILDNIGMKVK